MPDWLAESSRLVYGLVAITAAVVLFLWYKAPVVEDELPLASRKGRLRLDEDDEKAPTSSSRGFSPRTFYALAFFMVLAFGGTLALMDRLVVTDKEQIEFAVNELAKGTSDHDLDRVFAHVSDSFRWGTLDKKGFRGFADQVIRQYDVRSVKVWDFGEENISREGKTARITFAAKATGTGAVGQGAEFYKVVADFVLDPDGKWRLKSFELRTPLGQPVGMPGP